MSEFVPKEKYEGVWNGENVRFTRVWRGRRFTDEECAALCAGETLEVRDLVSQKTGKTYGVRAKLDKLKGKDTGREYIGIDIVNFLPRGLPEVFLKHQFTEDEKLCLKQVNLFALMILCRPKLVIRLALPLHMIVKRVS